MDYIEEWSVEELINISNSPNLRTNRVLESVWNQTMKRDWKTAIKYFIRIQYRYFLIDSLMTWEWEAIVWDSNFRWEIEGGDG